MEGDRGVFDGGVSRGRFLKLAGLGAGLSLFPGSLFSAGPGAAQVDGTPELLDPTRYPYPIAAWWPPPPVPNTHSDVDGETARRYMELAGAGFNTVIGGNGVSNKRANNLALKACADHNLRLVLDDSALRHAIEPQSKARSAGEEEPESVMQALTEQYSGQDAGARTVVDRQAAITQRMEALEAELLENPEHLPALAGILLDDEPGRSLFPILKFAKAEVRRVFGEDELPYVNVWPSHTHLSALEAESYTDYLRRYMDRKRYPNAVALPSLSFDHHPLLVDGRLTPDFFYNHAVIRNFAKRFGVPSWAFVQSVGFDGSNVGLGVQRRTPNEDDIFWQINVALAYGVKGIQYFTYWTPNDPDVEFKDALIARDENPTVRYEYARAANEFLRKVGGVLLPLTSVSVTHFGEKRLPRGAKAFRANDWVKAASGNAAILGLFGKPNDATERHLLVVNRSPNKAATTRLTISGTVGSVDRFDPSVEAPGEPFVPQPLTGSPRSFTVTTDAGRAILYRLRTA